MSDKPNDQLPNTENANAPSLPSDDQFPSDQKEANQTQNEGPQHYLWLTDRDQQVLVVSCALLVAVVLYFDWKLNYVDHSDVLIRDDPGVGYRIDINAASWPELTQLDGIGPSLAKRIVDDREENGPFASVNDLQRVSGIGPKTLEKNLHWLRVGQLEITAR
jgi:competence protein ComEA